MYEWFSVIPVLGAAAENEPGHLQMNTVKRSRKFEINMEDCHYSEILEFYKNYFQHHICCL